MARVLLIVLGALLLAGCGGEEVVAPTGSVEGTLPKVAAANPVAGKTVFESSGCGSCHTLKDAGTNGTVGPNLDDAKPPKSLVIDRVTNGKGVMPPFKTQLTQAQIDAVATYVSSVAGK